MAMLPNESIKPAEFSPIGKFAGHLTRLPWSLLAAKAL